MSQGEDMAAINRYMTSQDMKTKKAETIHDEWVRWWDGLGWWEKNFDLATYDKARNLRNTFNLANATNAAETAAVKRVMQTGITTEEMAGGTKRTLASGMYSEEDAPPGDLLTTRGKMAVILGATTLGLGYVIKKFYLHM